MVIRQEGPRKTGYNAITCMGDIDNNTLMDFGILQLGRNQIETDSEVKERAYLLIKGRVRFDWESGEAAAERLSFLDENPWCLHVPAGVSVNITGLEENTEICVTKTDNAEYFEPRFYKNTDCMSENRGQGTMKETSTRIVRTVFDKSNSPLSNLVLGEVISYPGKWSSYPPHHHPQPEIYHYRFFPENGYGFAQLGDMVVKVQNNDTVKILDDVSHPQVAAPGYAMYYIWVIRHLEGNPYITPVFEPEHLWVTDRNAKIWTGK